MQKYNYTSLSDLISLPQSHSLLSYCNSIRTNASIIFQLKIDESLILPLEEFLLNKDHGAEHAYNVYKKSLEIADEIEKQEIITIDKYLLYLMSLLHDIGRFHLHPNQNKRKKCELNHARCGVAQIRLSISKLKQKSKIIDLSIILKISDYIKNHDFFNKRMDGDKYHEPSSIEGQIVRLADRISVDVADEISRYWETGKRLKTPYFNKNITFKERLDFNFTKISQYIKVNKFDEFMFFLALLSMTENDFQHPILQKIYKNWSINKKQGINKIISLAQEEGYNTKDIEEIKKIIEQYLKHSSITF